MSEMNQGENAPPLHPRCRCTIIASFGEKISGSRISEGRKRIPAEMSYKEWLKTIKDTAEIPLSLMNTAKINELKAEVKSAKSELKNNPGKTAQDKAADASGRLTSYITGNLYKARLEETVGGVSCRIEYLQEKLKGGKIICQSKVYVTPDGVRFIFPEDLNPKLQTMTPEKAIALWQQVPEAIRAQGQRRIAFLDFSNEDDAHWLKVYKNFTQSYATGGEEIIFYRLEKSHSDEYVKKTYRHEIGHWIDKKIGGNTPYSKQKEWQEAMAKDLRKTGKKSVTNYGENSPAEDFAESVQLYGKGRAWMFRFINRRNLLDKIFQWKAEEDV